MGEKKTYERIFNLDTEIQSPVKRSLFKLGRRPLERLLAFNGLNDIYNEALSYETELAFADRLLDRMNVN